MPPPDDPEVWTGELLAYREAAGAVTTIATIDAELPFRQPHNDGPLELLIVVYNPHDYPLPEVGNEAVAVRAATNWGTACEHIFGTTVDELRLALLRRGVKRFLLCAHTDDLKPALTAPGGVLQMMDSSLLVRMLGQNDALKTVFINGCGSEALGRLCSANGLECVVCWSTKVHDEAAALFSNEFFRLVALGQSEREAFAGACDAVSAVKRPKKGKVVVDCIPKFELRDPDAIRDPHLTVYQPAPLAAGLPVMFLRVGGVLTEVRESGIVASTNV